MPKKILIIEDDHPINEFAAHLLGEAGYEVRQAFDGREGLDELKAFRPDMVVLDLMLPRVHGFELARRIRGILGYGDVHILVASSKAYSTDMEMAREAGADDYLTKPYTGEELLKKVRELFERGVSEKPAAEAEGSLTRKASEVEARAPQDVKKTGLRVRFWGTRGSTPTPGPDTIRYGGNTPCTEIRVGDLVVIVDCGSGMAALGDALLAGCGDGPVSGHIFVGHTHWDHIQGFPFFKPLYRPKNSFDVYSVAGAGKSLEKVFRGQMAADYFPIPLKNLACRLRFVELEETLKLGPLTVKFHFLNHPGVAIGYRFEAFGRSVTYISDHENFVRFSGDSEMNRKRDREVEDFCSGSDLLVCEAVYTEEEYESRRGWGHSTFSDAVALGLNSASKHLALFHHDPSHTDSMMDGFLEDCRRTVREAKGSLVVSAAREGETIRL